MTNPPIARRTPYTFTHLEHTFADDYHWLEDKTDPDVIAYIEAENAYSTAALEPTTSLRETIYQEMFGRIPQDDSTAPEKRGDNYYYSRVESGKQYRIFCRKQGSLDAPEEILLDENLLAQGHEYCKVYQVEPSPDQNFICYRVDFSGSWVFDLYILDTRTGQIVSGAISKTAWSIAWGSDSHTLFYSLFDDSHRSYQVMRHTVGADLATNVLVYHEADEGFTVEVARTRSGAYILLTSGSFDSSEVRYLPADQPTAPLKLIEARRPKVEYYADHHGDRFLIMTNEDAVNFRLMTAPVGQSARENWHELLPHRADVLIESIDAFQDDLVVYERRGGLQQIRLSASDSVTNVRYVAFPEPVYAMRRALNPEFATTILRFTFSSLITPTSTIDYEMERGAWRVVKQQQVPSGYNPALYTSERRYVTAPDGAQIPLSLVYRKDTASKSGMITNPALLYAYGSYGVSTEVDFEPMRLSLIDRGFVYAIAHIRGGSELGREWYEHGRLMDKMNTFTDFIACGEYLIANGYAHPRKLSILGGSAGGLLVTAVSNMRPDLFGAVIALVPFTNVIIAMLKPDLPLTVIEYEQWGNPNDPAAFDYMLSYSPYEHIEAKAYPPMYVQSGLNDLQVPYWDPAKWVAKLRATKTDQQPLLLITKMGAGHSGASGRYDRLGEFAQIYAFLVDTIGS